MKDGKSDGLTTGWHENGEKKIEGNWKHGKKNGIWYEWFKDGQKYLEKKYKDGTLVTAVVWKPNGVKSVGRDSPRSSLPYRYSYYPKVTSSCIPSLKGRRTYRSIAWGCKWGSV